MKGSASPLHVYYADRRTLTDDLAAKLLTDDDRQSCAAAAHPRRRAERLAGRALLRYALERYTGRNAQSHRFRSTAEGKPECEDGPAISLSHSGEIVVCAVADGGAVGIDVETRTPRTHAPALAAQHFTPCEAAWLEADPDRRFQMLWVLKEAYLKALGVGLAGGLRSLECRIEPPAIVAQVAARGAAPQLALYAAPGSHLGLAWEGAARAAIRFARFGTGGGDDAPGPFEQIAATA